jgi:dipeptidyl aminopeptidase/acylaminoacyl peptidase
MSRHLRALILVAGCLVLALDVAVLGYAFTRGGGMHLPKFPGRIAVRSGCGVQHMYVDGTDKRMMCLRDIFDELSVSRNGEKLAWDTKGGSAIFVSGVDGANPVKAQLPPGFNSAPSLSPDGQQVAFLHSANDDGNYDIWISSVNADDAEQVTNTRNVSDVSWAPADDRLVYVQNWSEDTEEGQLSLVRTDGSDPHTIGVDGDAPDWSSDGKHLVYVHESSLWVVDPDGENAHRLIPDAHAPAWSRDGEAIAFLRTVACSRNVCPERLMRAFSNGTEPQPVGATYPDQRRVVWLPDPFE